MSNLFLCQHDVDVDNFEDSNLYNIFSEKLFFFAFSRAALSTTYVFITKYSSTLQYSFIWNKEDKVWGLNFYDIAIRNPRAVYNHFQRLGPFKTSAVL